MLGSGVFMQVHDLPILREVVRLIRSELDAIAQDYVSEDELSRNIDLICGQLLLGLSRPIPIWFA